MFYQFEINHSNVEIDDQIVERPGYISPSQWLEFWDWMYIGNTGELATYDEGFEDAKLEYECECDEQALYDDGYEAGCRTRKIEEYEWS